MWRIRKAKLTRVEELGFLCTFVHGNLIKLPAKVKGVRILKFKVWISTGVLLVWFRRMDRMRKQSRGS